MRASEIIQAADIQNRDAHVQRRLGIRRKKSAMLRWMRVSPHVHLQGALDVRNRRAHFQNPPVRMAGCDCEATATRPGNHRLIVVLGGTESSTKLVRRKVMAV